MSETERGWYLKYVIGKADGSVVDPKADYLVLRLDTDGAAREAALCYAENCENGTLAADIRARVMQHEIVVPKDGE